MIDTNGVNSCKSDSDCKKMVTERLKLALTYYNGEEAKNYLINYQKKVVRFFLHLALSNNRF